MSKILVDKEALNKNIILLKSKMGENTKFCAVVKADAYGHGLKKIVKYTNKNVDYYAVANIQEAISIRKILPYKPILVLGIIPDKKIAQAIKNNIEITISNLEQFYKVYEISNLLKSTALLHIKINTGMNRLGIKDKKTLKIIEKTAKSTNFLKIIGIFTHFATVNSNKNLFFKQINKFNSFLNIIDRSKYLIHCSSSSAFLCDKNLCFDMVRVGLAMYGYDSLGMLPELKKVLSVSSKIIQINILKKGDFCGYDFGFVAPQKTIIGVVPIGYADGICRKYAYGGKVIIRDCICEIVGKICMDMLFVNLNSCPKAEVGDEVIILGQSKNCKIDASDIAHNLDTIEYEILTNFSKIRKD